MRVTRTPTLGGSGHARDARANVGITKWTTGNSRRLSGQQNGQREIPGGHPDNKMGRKHLLIAHLTYSPTKKAGLVQLTVLSAPYRLLNIEFH